MTTCANKDCKVPQKDQKLKKCSACLSVWYCSVDCQKACWKDHKEQCKSTNPTVVKLEKEIKKSRENGIPICIYCKQMLVMCKCKDRKNNTDGVAFAMSNVPRTYEEKLKGLKKWMKRMKQLKSPCDVDQFYNKFMGNGENIIELILRYEEYLKGMMDTLIKSPKLKEFVDKAFPNVPVPEVAVMCTGAVSKLVDGDFGAIGKYEVLVCMLMYDATPSTSVPQQHVMPLFKIGEFLRELYQAMDVTKNYPEM